MLRTGLTRPMFYCPSNANHQKFNDYFWMFNNQILGRQQIPNETRLHRVRVLLPAGVDASRTSGRKSVRYQTDTEKKVWLKSTLEQQPATKEVVVDSIMGNAKAGTKYGWNFRQVPGGIYSRSTASTIRAAI